MQQNCLVPFKLFQPLGKGKVIPLRLQSTFSLLNKQIHKQTWQSSRSNAKHFLVFGCRACCTVKLGLTPWVFPPVLLMHSKVSVLFMWGQNIVPCPGAVWAGIGQTSLPWLQEALPKMLPRPVPDPLILVMVQLLHFTSLQAWRNSTKIHGPSTQSGVKRD